MKREIHCHKCNQRNDQYWIDGKYRWLSSKSLNALNGWTIEPDDYTYTPNKQGWSIVCEDCQQERHDKRFFGKLKKLTIEVTSQSEVINAPNANDFFKKFLLR